MPHPMVKMARNRQVRHDYCHIHLQSCSQLFLGPNNPAGGLAITGAPQEFTGVVPTTQLQDMSSFLDDHLLAELGWTNSNNLFYPPIAGPYGTDWYSPTDVNGFAI